MAINEVIMKDFVSNLEALLDEVKRKNHDLCASLSDTVYLTDYKSENGIWTSALQGALNEHEVVIIPSSDSPYILDSSVIIPSNRHIICEGGAVIRLKEGVKVLALRNSRTADGTHAPITCERDENITIEGGVWEDWCQSRLGYGQNGMYDENRSFFGVSTFMLLENVNHLTLKNMTFRRCGGFAVQVGDARDLVLESIRFERCFADGLHINGNVENAFISDIKGEVGDDLVALNMFDWQNSSINFGPCKNVICQDLELSKNSFYKALRIEPGVYTYDDGTSINCSLTDAIFRRISGIKTFKLYCQTPPYSPTIPQERVSVGGGDRILFEDIDINLDAPIDLLDGYITNDPVKGSFAGFELGLNVENLYLKNIRFQVDKGKYPYAYLVCIGPKSARGANQIEYFDPCFSSVAKNVYLEDIKINGESPDDISEYIREIEFDHLYDDISSTGYGKIEKIHYKK